MKRKNKIIIISPNTLKITVNVKLLQFPFQLKDCQIYFICQKIWLCVIYKNKQIRQNRKMQNKCEKYSRLGAEEIKKRWQEYTEEMCNEGLNDLGNHYGVGTHLEPDILECEVG